MVFTEIINSFNFFWSLLAVIISIFVYRFIIRTWNYFSVRGVKFSRGIPFLGTQWKAFLFMEDFGTSFQNVYNEFPKEKMTGVYNLGGTPVYIIRDPELIKQLAIKDFEHFTNHQFNIHEDSDSMFGRSLLIMRDQRWKDMRATLSPAFTGSKMRLMFGLMVEVCQTFSQYLKDDSDKNGKVYDIKDIFTRFANDIIATCAFGINVDSMKEKNNEFYKAGVKLGNFDGVKGMKFIGYGAIPEIMNFFKIKVLPDNQTKYLKQIVRDNMEYRERNQVIRNDMINLLLEAKKGLLQADNDVKESNIGFATVEDSSLGKNVNKVKNWAEDDLIAQCMIFFLAGFGTVSQTLSFAAHELTVNPDVQQKLYEEIQETQEKLNGKQLSYDVLQKMKYIDMVMSETLRRWPQVPGSDRYVNKAYVIDDINGNKVHLNVGDSIIIPAQGLHMDPQYFPNPKKFNPERFNDDNKDDIVPGTYMPFGIGPRSCIASRFALMECKAVLYYLVGNFYLEKCEKTQDPLKLRKGAGSVDAEKGFWIKLRPRF